MKRFGTSPICTAWREGISKPGKSRIGVLAVTQSRKAQAKTLKIGLISHQNAPAFRDMLLARTDFSVREGVSLPCACEGVAQAHTDEARVRQMVINLLSNAFKFTHGGEVAVGAKVFGEEEAMDRQMLEISVRDTGVGIPPEKLEGIFVHVPNHSGLAQKGTGLGLSISKKFSELLGGSHFRSERSGHRFHFRHSQAPGDLFAAGVASRRDLFARRLPFFLSGSPRFL